MKAGTIFLAAVCGIAPALCAQVPGAPILKTNVVGETSMPRPIAATTAMCDGAGNLYLQQLPGPRGPELMINRPPIEKLSPDARRIATFRLPERYAGNVVTGFVNSDGRVYLLQEAHSGFYAVEVAADGTVKGRTQFDVRDVQVLRLAVFSSGEYLLVGLTGKDLRTPFTAVFSPDGQLLKKIDEPEDEEARRNPSLDGWQHSHLGDLDVGTDGNVYLLRGGLRPIVFVISSTGDVTRKLPIDPEGHKFTAGNIKFHAGQLAIRLEDQTDADAYLIKVIDTNGKPIGDYRVDRREKIGKVLACYDSDGLVMIKEAAASDISESKLELIRAKLP